MNPVASTAIATLLFIVGCANPIPDVPVCVNLPDQRLYCDNTISSKPTHIPVDQANNIRKHSLVMPIDSWAEIKAYILKECHNQGKCKEVDQRLKVIEHELLDRVVD